MVKHRRERIPLGERLVIIFFVLFTLTVAAIFAVGFGNARKLQAQYVAEEAAFLDASWIDSRYSLSWIADQIIYHRDEGGVLQDSERHVLLQTYGFDGRPIKNMQLDGLLDDERNEAMIIPADDPRGYMVAVHANDLWTLYHVDDAEAIIPLYSDAAKTIREIFACYDGKIYGYVNRNGNTLFAGVDLETGEECFYRGSVACLASDGRAALLEPRSTGEYVTYIDADGVKRAAEYMPGWTLGIGDAKGKWTPLLPVGNDSEYIDVPCAAWLGEDLIFFAQVDDRKSKCILYRYAASTGKIAPFLDERGAEIEAQDDFLAGNLAVSPDGRYIAYRIRDFLYYEESHIVVQSLETGRVSRLPTMGIRMEGSVVPSLDGVSIWHK